MKQGKSNHPSPSIAKEQAFLFAGRDFTLRYSLTLQNQSQYYYYYFA